MKLKSALLLSSVVSAGILLSGGMAHAGFEWTPPSQPEPSLSDMQDDVSSQMIPDDTGLVPPVGEDMLANPMPDETVAAPVPVLQNNVQQQMPTSSVDDGAPLSVVAPASAPIHDLPPEQVLKAPSTPSAPAAPAVRAQYTPPPVSPAPTPAQQPLHPVSPMDEVVNGFGKDVPLVTAVRQLVPASYTYKFTPDVDLGTTVSWNGGQSLRDTLSTVLASGGYTYDLQGNMISITSVHAQPMMAPASMPETVGEDVRDIPGFNDVIQQNLVEAEAEMIAPPAEQIASTPETPEEKQVFVKPVSPPVSLVSPKVEYNAADDMMVPLMDEESAASTAKMVAPPAAFANGMRPTYSPVSLSSYPDTQQVRTWSVKRNADLKSTLASWSRQAGVGLQWNADRNFSIDYMVWVDGTYEEALAVLMKGYANKTGPVPHTRFELQDGQSPVLVVDTVTQ